MTLKTILFGAASALVLSAGAANAVPATAETSLNVRSGPGTQYGVVGTLAAGETVDARDCTGGWCRVSFSGGTGYASRSYLAMAGGGTAVAAAPGYVYDEPYYGDYYDYGYGYGPSFGFYVNPGRRFHHGWHGGRWGHGHAWNGGGHHWNGGGNWAGRPGGGNWAGRPGGRPGGMTAGGRGMGGGPRGGGMAAGSVSPQVSAPAGMGGGAAVSAGGGRAVGGGGAAIGGGAPAGGASGGGAVARGR